MTFQQYLALVDAYYARRPTLRYGDAIMNVLHSVRPDLYDRAHEFGSGLNTYHTSDPDDIRTTLQWIERRLSSKENV